MGESPSQKGGDGVKDIKKSRPGDCSTRTAAETGTACETASSSISNDITAAEVRQIQISDFLGHGQENAVPRRYLRQLTGLSDRELRRRIQEERLSGCPILSDNQSGYYLPADDGERARFVRSMRGRAQEIQAVAAAVEGTGEMSEISPPSEG